MKINLFWLSRESEPPRWALGNVVVSSPEPRAVDETLRTVLPTEEADAWLFWDARLPLAKVEVLEALLQQQNDVFHAGLLLGSAGQPGLIDYVSPT